MADHGLSDPPPGILHTIFFHRFFPALRPQTRDVLDLPLPFVPDVELETMIDQRASALARKLDAERTQPHGQRDHGHGHGVGGAGGGGGSGRGQVVVQFFDKKRRKAWFNVRGADEEICWETWTVKVTVAEPKTESGELHAR